MSQTPWDSIAANGENLDVFYFPTTLMSIVGNCLRREITMPYIEEAGLTFAEWRILSVLAQGSSLSFLEIEILSSTDKSLVSRTLRLLEQRGFITIKDRGHTGRKQLTGTITSVGKVLNSHIMEKAQAAQANLLNMLEPQERAGLFGALEKWHQHFTGKPLPNPQNIREN